ncbi:MAG: hypothetical protein WAL75_22650 [Terracidiphilus sp.]
MSDLEPKPQEQSSLERDNEDRSKGPSLILIYSLIAFALIASIFLAGLIVLPFYRRR